MIPNIRIRVIYGYWMISIYKSVNAHTSLLWSYVDLMIPIILCSSGKRISRIPFARLQRRNSLSDLIWHRTIHSNCSAQHSSHIYTPSILISRLKTAYSSSMLPKRLESGIPASVSVRHDHWIKIYHWGNIRLIRSTDSSLLSNNTLLSTFAVMTLRRVFISW